SVSPSPTYAKNVFPPIVTLFAGLDVADAAGAVMAESAVNELTRRTPTRMEARIREAGRLNTARTPARPAGAPHGRGRAAGWARARARGRGAWPAIERECCSARLHE